MAALPVFFKEINEIRRKFNTDEYMRFEYHYSPKVANFEMVLSMIPIKEITTRIIYTDKQQEMLFRKT